MAKLFSYEAGQVTAFDLDANAFWRLHAQAASIGDDPALALSIVFPPGFQFTPHGSGVPTQVHILRVPIPVAADTQQVARVAEVMLQGGTEEDDKIRTKEAFMLFKNAGRAPSEERLNSSIESGYSIVNAYWQIRSWIKSGYQGALNIEVEGTEIVGTA